MEITMRNYKEAQLKELRRQLDEIKKFIKRGAGSYGDLRVEGPRQVKLYEDAIEKLTKQLGE